MGVFKFLSIVCYDKINEAQALVNVLDFCEDINQDLIDKEITVLSNKNVTDFIYNVFLDLKTERSINSIISYLKSYVEEIESFSLEFNLNNRESIVNMSPLYKDVRTLSLGQKVVAMLAFILGFSEYSKDFRPLIIDQPEDNLDNQYIYKNLVKQLRSVKEKRQVIIATHSATIVTNAKADQVCVMVSDNNNGWIETTGYPGENRIKKTIINYLEGGMDSFIHKLNVYKDVLSIVKRKR